MTKADKYANDPGAVDEFLAKLDHPLKDEVQAVREIIKGAAPGIKEQVKGITKTGGWLILRIWGTWRRRGAP